MAAGDLPLMFGRGDLSPLAFFISYKEFGSPRLDRSANIGSCKISQQVQPSHLLKAKKL
jgi:hypothetical protein